MIPKSIRQDQNGVSSFIALLITIIVLLVIWEGAGQISEDITPISEYVSDYFNVTVFWRFQIHDITTNQILTKGDTEDFSSLFEMTDLHQYKARIVTNAPFKILTEKYTYTFRLDYYNETIADWQTVATVGGRIGIESWWTNTYYLDFTFYHDRHYRVYPRVYDPNGNDIARSPDLVVGGFTWLHPSGFTPIP